MYIALHKKENMISLWHNSTELNITDDCFNDLMSQIKDEYKPEELYIIDDLDKWALNNGYTKGNKNEK